jgi:hypothetical protein
MPTYRRLDLEGGTIPGTPSIGNVLSPEVARASHLHQQFLAQDRILGSGRRILLRAGLAGSATEWRVPTSDPEGTGLETHPQATDEYTVARATQVPLTPGHVLRLYVAYLPAGMTQTFDAGEGEWVGSGSQGSLKLTTTWRAQGGWELTSTTQIPLAGSGLTDGAPPGSAGGQWVAARTASQRIVPGDIQTVLTYERHSAPGSTVDLELEHVGSPRIIDACVVEEPLEAAREISRNTWTPAHLYTANASPLTRYPARYPVREVSADDPALGTETLQEVTREIGKQLGPALWSWSSANEDQGYISSASEGGGVSTTSTSYVCLTHPDVTTWSENGPGLDLSAAAHARRYEEAGWPQVLRGVQAVAQVRVRVRAQGVGTIKIQTAPWSSIEIPVSTGAFYEWSERIHRFCLGISPEEQAYPVMVFFKATTGTLLVRQVTGYVYPEAPLPGEPG